MIEIGNILDKDDKVIFKFYIVGPYFYISEFGRKFNQTIDEYKKDLFLFVDGIDDDSQAWYRMKSKFFKKNQDKNDYKIYWEALSNEYLWILDVYPNSYVDTVQTEEQFKEITNLFIERR